MEVLRESVLARGSPSQRFRALLVNFKKLRADPPPIPPLDDASAATSSGERGEEVGYSHLERVMSSLLLPHRAVFVGGPAACSGWVMQRGSP